jgi:nicotinamidase-related amidase
MKNTVLLVVDMQEVLIAEKPIFQQQLIENVKDIINFCRSNQVEVIYVRHQDNEEGSPLVADSPGWQIYHEIKPKDHEKIIDKKFNSAFYQTDLDVYLKSKSIENIIIVGMQTEYCIDSTIKSAFDLNYHVYIPKGYNSTFDSTYVKGQDLINMYNKEIWGNFATVIEDDELKKQF